MRGPKVDAERATIQRIQANIDDSQLRSSVNGRVQYRVAQWLSLGAGGRVLNLVNLSDVYMTFFLPDKVGGRSGRWRRRGGFGGLEPSRAQFVIPAKGSFVANVAQFTPKTVETAEERQKLTFRIIARHLALERLRQYRSRGQHALARHGLCPARSPRRVAQRSADSAATAN